jgi:predicted membrane protein
MPIFFSKHKKLILSSLLILLISSLGIFVLGIEGTKAFWPFDKLINIDVYALITGVIAAIGVALQAIVSLFFWFGAMLLEIALDLGEFTEAGVVGKLPEI